MIHSVVGKNGNTKREDYENEDEIEDWMYSPRIISKTSMKVQIFFTVYTSNSIPILVKD